MVSLSGTWWQTYPDPSLSAAFTLRTIDILTIGAVMKIIVEISPLLP